MNHHSHSAEPALPSLDFPTYNAAKQHLLHVGNLLAPDRDAQIALVKIVHDAEERNLPSNEILLLLVGAIHWSPRS